MNYFVYLLISKTNSKIISYVGYTKDINKRIEDHNKSKGAKFTKGRIWEIAYCRNFKTKIMAMKEEYKLKKNYNLRKEIKDNFIKSKMVNFK